MVRGTSPFPVQWGRKIHFEEQGSLSEIIYHLKHRFLPGLSEADLNQPVRIDFAAYSDSGEKRLVFQSQGGLERILWRFKRSFLDPLPAQEFRRKGVLRILRDNKVIQPNPGIWAAPQDDGHLEFFGLEENPFAQTPNPRYFYASPIHSEAISRLTYAINRKLGFALITGEIGSGKTTVCRTALRSLDRGARVALITSTFLTRNELLIALCDEFDLEPQRRRKINYLRVLQHYLIEQYERDRLVVVVLDEAQNLSPPVLEEVRMLSNLETDEEKLIQIVFLGQPELVQKIDTPELEQLRQRVGVRYHLNALDLTETRRYIEHRLSVAGCGRACFLEGACLELFEHSGGIPRLINRIGEASLLVAYKRRRLEITVDTVRTALLDLEGKSAPPEPMRHREENARPNTG